MDYKNPGLVLEKTLKHSGKIGWRSPSNIALVKYWGKHGVQLPRNPSISFTLNSAFTETFLEYSTKGVKASAEIDLEFFFEGKPAPDFSSRISGFLHSLLEIFPFLSQLSLKISSANSFPHSAGIASSASAMSALALCLCSLEEVLFSKPGNGDFLKKASYISRLGSGSACRSVYPGLALWGKHELFDQSSDLFAIPVGNDTDNIFHSFHDAILLIDQKEKKVSSRAGHGLMEGNPYSNLRYQQAGENISTIWDAMKTGDLESFGRITESEALTLHALMMTSDPSYILMAPNSLEAIAKVRTYREATGHPLYFTLDAGPNLHLLYPDLYKLPVESFIKAELAPLCDGGKWISDRVGKGPERI